MNYSFSVDVDYAPKYKVWINFLNIHGYYNGVEGVPHYRQIEWANEKLAPYHARWGSGYERQIVFDNEQDALSFILKYS